MNEGQDPYNPFTWDVWTAGWAVWVLLFIVLETWAVAAGNSETLSHHIWWLRNNGPSIIFFLIVGLLAWLAYHFIFEGH